MYNENELVAVALRNNLPSNASILNFDRDPDRTSEKYRPTDDVAIVQTLNNMGWNITSYQQRKAHDPSKSIYRKFLATYTNPTLPNIGEKGRVTIVERNSKDGVSSNEFFAGMDIFACLNGMIVGTQLFAPLKIRHKGNIPEELDRLVASLADKLPIVGERVTQMSALRLTESQCYEFARKAIELRFGEENANGVKPDDILRARRNADNTQSLWDTMNRLQENLFRPENLRFTRSDGKVTTARRIRNIDVQVKVNTGIWDLAETYLVQ